MPVSFDGRWSIDLNRSKIWDDQAQQYVPDTVGSENLIISTVDDVQTVQMEIGLDPVVRLEYINKYNDEKWAPYVVKSISGRDESEAVEEFSSRLKLPQAFEVGSPIFLVRTIFVDERTHYRINLNAKSRAPEYVMCRRLSEDGGSFVSSVMMLNGVVAVVRTFVRS